MTKKIRLQAPFGDLGCQRPVNREGMNCLRMYLPYLCAFHLFDESKENKTSERAFANMCSEWYNPVFDSSEG